MATSSATFSALKKRFQRLPGLLPAGQQPKVSEKFFTGTIATDSHSISFLVKRYVEKKKKTHSSGERFDWTKLGDYPLVIADPGMRDIFTSTSPQDLRTRTAARPLDVDATADVDDDDFMHEDDKQDQCQGIEKHLGKTQSMWMMTAPCKLRMTTAGEVE
ncbi:hypothetical protein DFJ73DRAFT_761784 [Zopfochytrium polystomum]|nr:hypothetical protein DFJ73DRAFT_761784 [Zopfochytrium polystomum]